MHRRPLVVLIVLAVGLGAAHSAAAAQRITVSELVNAVTRALQDSAGSMAGLPPMKNVTLTLTTIRDQKTGGGFALFVKAAGSRLDSESQQITVQMVPPKPERTIAPGPDVYVSLKNALVLAANAAKEAKTAGGSLLALDGFSAQIGFDVTREASGGLSFTIGPISIDGSVGGTNTVSNKITVVFENKK